MSDLTMERALAAEDSLAAACEGSGDDHVWLALVAYRVAEPTRDASLMLDLENIAGRPEVRCAKCHQRFLDSTGTCPGG